MEPAEDQEAVGESGGPNSPAEITVDAPVDVRTGRYTNFVRVSHDQDAVTLDFFSLEQPYGDQGEGILQARMHMSHRMAIRFLQTLHNNLQKLAPKELQLRREEERQIAALFDVREADENDTDQE